MIVRIIVHCKPFSDLPLPPLPPILTPQSSSQSLACPLSARYLPPPAPSLTTPGFSAQSEWRAPTLGQPYQPSPAACSRRRTTRLPRSDPSPARGSSEGFGVARALTAPLALGRCHGPRSTALLRLGLGLRVRRCCESEGAASPPSKPFSTLDPGQCC